VNEDKHIVVSPDGQGLLVNFGKGFKNAEELRHFGLELLKACDEMAAIRGSNVGRDLEASGYTEYPPDTE
jgi:hypothetical protein